jgi:hypothetical protein
MTSQYGRPLRQTQFYEPENTIKDDYTSAEHDFGQFDSNDWTFMGSMYQRYKFDNYDPPHKGGGVDNASSESDASYDSSFVSFSSGYDDNATNKSYKPSDSDSSISDSDLTDSERSDSESE